MALKRSGWAMFFKVLLAEGLVLLVFGGINLVVAQSTALLALAFLGLGLLLAIAGAIGTFASLGEWVRSGRARFALLSLAYVLLILVGLGLVNYLSQARFNRALDLTRAKVNTLSDRTVEVLASIKQPVKILAFLPDYDPERAEAERMLDLYKSRSTLLTVEFIDPIKNPLPAQEYGFVERAGLVAESRSARHAFFEVTEPAVTNAILNVTQGSKGKVYFLTGHGEPDPDVQASLDEGSRGSRWAADLLRNESYEVAKVDLLTAGSVPADSTALVVFGPTKELMPQEVQAIASYLASGGRAMFLLEPLIVTGLEPLLADYGVELPDSIVIETDPNLTLRGIDFVSKNFASHSVTSKIRDGVVLLLARAVIPSKNKPADAFVTPLMSTSASSWAETDLKALLERNEYAITDADINGPVSIAVVVESVKAPGPGGLKGRNARMIVIGDSSFAEDKLITLGRDNSSLFLNAMNWLAESEPVEVIAHRYDTSLVTLESSQAEMLFYAIVFVVPQVLILLGIALIGFRRISR